MAIRKYLQVMIFDSVTDLPASADNGQPAWCVDASTLFKFNGTLWAPENRVQVKRAQAIVNGKNTGITKIYTLENSSSNFFPTQVIPRASNIGGVITPPAVSIGTNASSYNNISAGGGLSALLSALGVTGTGAPQMSTYSPALAPLTEIYANVTLAAAATNYSVAFDILGYYDN